MAPSSRLVSSADLANAFGLKTSCCAITKTLAYVQYASTLCFACAPFLAPKSLRQIWNPWFSERTPKVLTNLSWEVRFFCWITDNGDFRVCLIRFNPPFRLHPVFSSKIIAPNRIPLVFRTNFGSVNEPLMGGSFFCGERGGDRSIGDANLRKGRQPLLWKRHCRPLQWKRHCRFLQWKRYRRTLQWKRAIRRRTFCSMK